MAIPYYRFFPGDYARDTRHLSLTQHGVYRLLIDLYMDQAGPIRNDLPYIHRWLHAESVEEKNACEFVLAEFFTLKGPKWAHARCDRELTYQAKVSAGGQAAAQARWHKNNELHAGALPAQSERNANQNQNQNQNQEKPTSKSKPFVRAKRAPQIELPESWDVTREMGDWAVKQGIAPDRVAIETRQFIDHCKAKGKLFTDWSAAWRTWMRNAVRFAQERQ